MANNEKVDIALKKQNNGIYDISIGSNGDLETTKGFDTAILMSIFCRRRADESEIPFAKYREGWLGNEFNRFNDYELGSKIWLLRQARRTPETLNLMRTYLEEAFDWMIEDGHIDDVQVVTTLAAQGVDATIDFIRNGVTVESRSFKIWDNTFDTYDN